MTAEEFKYTNYMTLKEWKRFAKYYKRDNKKPIKDYLIEMNTCWYDFDSLITCGIDMAKTKEGYDYWDKVALRNEPLNQKLDNSIKDNNTDFTIKIADCCVEYEYVININNNNSIDTVFRTICKSFDLDYATQIKGKMVQIIK